MVSAVMLAMDVAEPTFLIQSKQNTTSPEADISTDMLSELGKHQLCEVKRVDWLEKKINKEQGCSLSWRVLSNSYVTATILVLKNFC